ncbi:MAG: hypothetical protein GXO48_03600 [Chlorobi bacterium]|nr:hypothetical protein [Chlorobiota bacterium]
MRKLGIIVGLIALLGLTANAQSYTGTGIGLRAGEPSGITVKLYTGNSAFEFNFGTSIWSWGFANVNRRALKAAEANKPHTTDVITSYDVYYSSRRIGLQAIYQPIFSGFSLGTLTGFFWYVGFGAQLNFGTLAWEAWYDHPDEAWAWWGAYDHYLTGTMPDIDIGPVGMGGVEWILADYNIPLALSVDLAVFMEVFDHPMGKFYLLGNSSIKLLIGEL